MKSFGDLMKQAQKMQKQMAEVQERLEGERFEASAGGGAVKAVVNGKQKLIALTITPDALKDADAALLEDLLIAAIGEAQSASEKAMQESLSKVTGGFPMPF